MNKTYKYFIVALLAVVLVIPSPILALAKDNGNSDGRGNGKGHKTEKVEKKEQKKVEKSQKNEDRDDDNRGAKIKKNNISWVGCFTKSFGHLIAPGWIKKNGQITLSDDCTRDNLPNGIGWLYGYHSTTTNPTPTTTPDTTSPVLSNVRVRAISTTTAIVAWDTNEKSDTTVWYSTTSPVNTSTASSSNKTELTRNHNIHLSGLSASTTYYVIVRSKDKSNNTSTSTQISFTTLGTPTTTTQVAPVISNVIATVGTSTVKVIWDTDVASNSTLFYGTSTPLNISASTTASTTSSTLVTSHDMNVTGLATSTTYYFVIQSKNSVGTIKNSNQFSLTTSF